MPHYIRCVVEDTWLTGTRPLPTWLAAERLAAQLSPGGSKYFSLLRRKRLADALEVKAWTEVFFKVREYVPPKPPVNLGRFYTPSGMIDMVSLAKAVGMDVSEAAVMIRMLDKALMVAVVEEILQAVKHSHVHQHKIEFAKSRA
jgi:hypothetical protein